MRKYAGLFFLTMFLIGTDTFLISPLLPTLAHLYGISTAISGWMVSAYAIGYACFALISGPIADGHDRKQVMLWGLFAFAGSTFLCGWATSFSWMLIFRFLAGVSASFITPQVWATIPVIIDRQNVVKVMGYATAGLSVSQLIGIPIGSYLAAWSWQTPFFIISLAALLLLGLTAWTFPHLTTSLTTAKSFITIYTNVLHNSRALVYLLAYLVFQTGSFTVMTFISTWFTADFGLRLAGVGTAMIAIGAGNLLGSLFGNRLVDWLSLPTAFLIELITLIGLYLIIAWVHTFWLAEILLAIAFVINGCLFPLFMTTLQATARHARSTISSLSNAAMYLGETVAGIAGGVLFKQFTSYRGIGLFAATMIGVALIIYVQSGLFKSRSN